MSGTREKDAPAPVAWRGYVRAIVGGALGAALVTGAAWCWDAVSRSESLRMHRVVVSGPHARVAPNAVYTAVRPHLAHNFLAQDLDAVRADVEALPWVAQAVVRREWPGTLRVEYREESPVAVWRGERLLNAAAKPFVALDAATRTELAALPVLAGPDGTEAQVLQMLRDMQRVAGDRLPAIARLELSDRRAWELWLADGTRVRLGRRETLVRLARYAEVAAPLVGPQAQHIAYVDMRYANGFTVGWRGAAPDSGASARKAAKRKRTDV